MAAQVPSTVPVGPDSLITVKVALGGSNRRFKLALRDLGAHVLPQKLRVLLDIPPEADAVFERFSDSAGNYVVLDSSNPAIYKQLYRAAKAKLKLRIKATITKPPVVAEAVPNIMDEQECRPEPPRVLTPPKSSPVSRNNFLETVLSAPRELKCQHRLLERSSASSRSALASPHSPTAAMSLDNATNETLVNPTKTEPFIAARKENFDKSSLLGSGDLQRDHHPFNGNFCIDCNHCGKSIRDEHYHCDICDDGDFDLCRSCIASGVCCEGEGHWLIMRRIQNGILISSVTETIAPKKWKEGKAVEKEEHQEGEKMMKNQPQPHRQQQLEATGAKPHTCNSCINKLPTALVVTCTICPDYYLCMVCLSLGDHGHNPVHRFRSAFADSSKISPNILSLCESGRGHAHAAICDGCDKHIYGVRHKCLSCPDFDYCSSCVLSAAQIHPGHRFAALFEPIADLNNREEVHNGIYCDGPLCASKSVKRYIQGTRYKCAVCHDTDFCANCEAIPTHRHNRTHPLIKFKTPVRHVSVTTLSEKYGGLDDGVQMGDRPSARNAATETTLVDKAVNTATPVQTVAEVKPMDGAVSEKREVDDLQAQRAGHLQACFEYDLTPDGSELPPDRLFSQVWTIRNSGPKAWPAGCAVYFTGGDHMPNVDTKNPSSVTAMAAANKSNALEKVEPGMSAKFVVLLKSPEREGRAISYWRLKTAEGIPFGCQLWVDITVTASADVDGEKIVELGEPGPEEVRSEVGQIEEGSTMIFPKLDKESPVSSTHGLSTEDKTEATNEREDGEEAEEELAEDLERLDLEASDESDDGFLTDEEYDILDASDEDLFVDAPKAAQK